MEKLAIHLLRMDVCWSLNKRGITLRNRFI